MKKDSIYLEVKKQLNYSYAPYSKFKTAAIVVTDKGKFAGSNVENASYSLTVCAERCAIFNAIAHGAKEFKKLYLISSSNKLDVVPCGSCLQVMAEFFNPSTPIIVYANNGKVVEYQLKDLLPTSFTKKELNNAKKK